MSLYAAKLRSTASVLNDQLITDKIEEKIKIYETKLTNINLSGASNQLISKNLFLEFDNAQYCFELFMDCCKYNLYMFQFIPDYYKTPEFLLKSVKQNGYIIQYIAQEFRTNEMMLEAVKNNGDAIQHIAQEFRTNEMMLEAIRNCNYAIKYIDCKFRTNEMYDLIVELKRYDNYMYLPNNYVETYYQNKHNSFEIKYNDLNSKYNDLNLKHNKLLEQLKNALN